MIVIDRFEGGLAVLEIGDWRVVIPRSALPGDCKEGDVLEFLRKEPDLSEAEARLERLKEKTPQGPGTFDL